MANTDKRPVWLLSMDSDQFYAAPTTTAGLKAYYLEYGKYVTRNQIELLHFRDAAEVHNWSSQLHVDRAGNILFDAKKALEKGQTPIIGFSFYTWNAAEFLEVIEHLKTLLPEIFIIAGGPHVQQAEDYLGSDPIDLIFLGEAERTFKEVLDNQDNHFGNIPGLAFLDPQQQLVKTAERTRIKDLNEIPSPLSALKLQDEQGRPLYESISYETSRGCPFTCAFCEWGTGAIGSKIIQFSMTRIYQDWEKIITAGIENIWLADSNFGALKEDLEKTQLICDLKKTYNLPRTFATSWSKKHSPRTQEMVLLLNRNGLLPHYQLALQTLTPLALELSNRKNMDSNKYERIAKDMAEAGVPIAAELIWGLPGDNLKDFEKNLDTLLATFPNINIFGYTLLPGTEFYDKREEYQIQSMPVAGYGKAKGEYVIGCHTFDKDEGIEGYFLITAHILLLHGHLLPLTIRYLAIEGSIPVTPLLREILSALLKLLAPKLTAVDINNKMSVYENRNRIYLVIFQQFLESYNLITRIITRWLQKHDASNDVISKTLQHIQLDSVLSPLPGDKTENSYNFPIQAREIIKSLEAMEIPQETFYQHGQELTIQTPGGVGDILKDPDGGSWLKGQVIEPFKSLAVEIH